jgi:hypothetical protein
VMSWEVSLLRLRPLLHQCDSKELFPAISCNGAFRSFSFRYYHVSRCCETMGILDSCFERVGIESHRQTDRQTRPALKVVFAHARALRTLMLTTLLISLSSLSPSLDETTCWWIYRALQSLVAQHHLAL